MTSQPRGAGEDASPDELWRAVTAELAARARLAFGQLDGFLAGELRGSELDHRPTPNSWSAREVLEHVHLTDRSLLRLVDKLGETSVRRAERGDPWPTAAPDLESIEAIAAREFRWPHPEHMSPTGTHPMPELGQLLTTDLARVLDWLERLPAGEGTLHRIRMSVVPRDEDRLHLYEYVLVLVLHAERHVGQIKRNLSDFAGETA